MSLKEQWDSMQDLSESGDADARLVLRLLHSHSGVRLYAAMRRSTKAVGVAIEVSGSVLAKLRLPPPAKRVRVTPLDGNYSDLPSGTSALLIELLDREFRDLFNHLGEQLIAAITKSDGESVAMTAVIRVLEHWMRFMDRTTPPLSESEVKGLIGELHILERLASGLGTATALDAWKSPGGSIRDFESARYAVEVKAFSSSQGATVRINDPLQLEPDPGLPVYLACVELAATTSTSDSLEGHAERVASRFADDAQASERYWLLLASAGFPRGAGKLFAGMSNWRAGGIRLFEISDGFPRIKPADVPPEVLSVRFSLKLANLGSFAAKPDEVLGKIIVEE